MNQTRFYYGRKKSTLQVGEGYFLLLIEGWNERLREQRDLIGLNQSTFGEIGGVKKQTQIAYEQGKSSPDLKYLQAIEVAGVDVLYVLTGKRSVDVDKVGVADAEKLPIDADALAGVIEGVETALANRCLRLAPDKKAQVVTALYEYFKATGQPNAAAVERYLNLAS